MAAILFYFIKLRRQTQESYVVEQLANNYKVILFMGKTYDYQQQQPSDKEYFLIAEKSEGAQKTGCLCRGGHKND